MANIWACRMRNGACVKIPYKGFEISIAFDDSCGAFQHYSRSSIAVFETDIDVTASFFTHSDQTYITGDSESLKRIMDAIDLHPCRLTD